jgi:hypothetical protein
MNLHYGRAKIGSKKKLAACKYGVTKVIWKESFCVLNTDLTTPLFIHQALNFFLYSQILLNV